MTNPQEEIIEPDASALIESMRDIGYSFETAAADLIDNSIAANASMVEVLIDFDRDDAHVAFIDDGAGMTAKELREAMRPGTKGPHVQRKANDLGRFGLGLKTASFSQCRRMTAITRCAESQVLHALTWDLDRVKETRAWTVQIPDLTTPLISTLCDRLGHTGTLVVWEKLDRLSRGSADDHNKLISEAGDHLELVFHRFINARGGGRVRMKMNGLDLNGIDPFLEDHPASTKSPEQTFSFGNGTIRVKGFTVPHHNKMSQSDYKKSGLKDGHAKNQGFYVYRRRRLIMHGGWFGLVRPSSHRQLARVRVDIPVELDSEWRIDIKKSSAQLPPEVRQGLKNIVDTLGKGSVRTYEWNGRLKPLQEEWGLWSRRKSGSTITYEVNAEHEAVRSLRTDLTDLQSRALDRALALIAASLPLHTIFSDFGSKPTDIKIITLDEEDLLNTIRPLAKILASAGKSADEIHRVVTAMPHLEGSSELIRNAIETTMNGLTEENVDDNHNDR